MLLFRFSCVYDFFSHPCHELSLSHLTVRITGGGGELSWFQEARPSMFSFTLSSILSTRWEPVSDTQVLSNSSVAKYELYFKLFTTDAPAVKYSTLILTGDNNCVSCSPAGHCRVHPLPSLLWLHHPDGAVILAADGHDWLLRSLHVHQKNLRCRKDWLSRPVAALLIIIIFFLWSLFYCLFFPFFIYIFLFVVSNKHWLVCRKQKEFLRCCSPSHWTHEGE